jgi:hypothetical protein
VYFDSRLAGVVCFHYDEERKAVRNAGKDKWLTEAFVGVS